MATVRPDLIRRQEALAATLAKYRNRPFDWSKGTTCVHMARFHLRQMGHRPERLPQIRSVLAARRALEARGWADVRAMLASMLPGIAPAAMLPGDLATADGPDGLGGILICAGPAIPNTTGSPASCAARSSRSIAITSTTGGFRPSRGRACW